MVEYLTVRSMNREMKSLNATSIKLSIILSVSTFLLNFQTGIQKCGIYKYNKHATKVCDVMPALTRYINFFPHAIH